MTAGQGRGRELARRLLRNFTNRGVAVAADLVAAGVATVVAASAATHSTHVDAMFTKAYSPRPSIAGPTEKSGQHARTARRGHQAPATLRHPDVLRLQRAHGK